MGIGFGHQIRELTPEKDYSNILRNQFQFLSQFSFRIRFEKKLLKLETDTDFLDRL